MEEQILKAKQGDTEAFTNLLLAEKYTLYKVARSRLQDENDIEDVMQETMMIAYTNLNKLRDNTKFEFWLLRILINQCNAYYRKKKVVELAIEQIDEIPQKESTQEWQWEELLQYICPQDRIVVVLYYNNGYTTKQIAQLLSKNENTIKTRLRRTKEKLRKVLESEE